MPSSQHAGGIYTHGRIYTSVRCVSYVRLPTSITHDTRACTRETACSSDERCTVASPAARLTARTAPAYSPSRSPPSTAASSVRATLTVTLRGVRARVGGVGCRGSGWSEVRARVRGEAKDGVRVRASWCQRTRVSRQWPAYVLGAATLCASYMQGAATLGACSRSLRFVVMEADPRPRRGRVLARKHE